jgi:hypothetical protein
VAKKERPPARDSKRSLRGGLTRDGESIAARVDGAAKKTKPERKRSPRSPATLYYRDTLMLTRLAQGWSLRAIAAEAGVTERQASRAIERRKAETPLVLNIDPVKVVEDVALGLQLSIGDLELVAAEGMSRNQLNVAVGAKRAANDARGQVISLLQDVGRLPQDLSSLRHLLDLKEVALRMVTSVDVFVEEIERGGDPEAAAHDVRRTFDELIGADSPPQLEAVS